MSKRENSKYKIDRRLRVNLWGRPKSPINKREYGPGQHGQGRQKPTDYRLQLMAKQRLKGYYGSVSERQLRRYYTEAVRRKGDTGENLVEILERRLDAVIYRMKFAITGRNLTFNDNARGWRLAREALKYALFREGFLASTSVPIRLYFRTRVGLDSPDATISIAPFLYEMVGKERRVSARKGITKNVNVLRSESTGSVHIRSADPAEPPSIRFNFLSTDHDRDGIVKVLRKGRELMATSPLREITGEEIAPGAHLQSDAELLEWVRNNAETTYHPVGTCKMGNDPRAVVDPELRVHGLQGLRVADASIMPTLTSGNTNAPTIMIGEKCAAMMMAAAA